MKISEERAIDIDAICHELMPGKCPYGKFKVCTTVKDKKGVIFGGLELFIDIVPKRDGKCPDAEEKKEGAKPKPNSKRKKN